MNFSLNLDREQFMAIMAIVYHVRLGSDNKFTEAISNLAIDLERNGWSETFNSLKNDFGVPEVTVVESDYDDAEIVLSEGEVEW